MNGEGSRYADLLGPTAASLSVREVAEKLGVSTHVVRRLVVGKELQGMKIGQEWRVFRADLIRYLERVSNDVDGSSTDGK